MSSDLLMLFDEREIIRNNDPVTQAYNALGQPGPGTPIWYPLINEFAKRKRDRLKAIDDEISRRIRG